MEKWKLALSMIIGLLGSFINEYGAIIALVAIAIIFDFATGVLKAKITSTMSSKKSFLGVWKKIALLTALFFGIFLDFFIPLLASFSVHIDIPFALPFGLIMGAYIILNESISICENLYQCGFKVPQFIINMLKVAESQIEPKESEDK